MSLDGLLTVMSLILGAMALMSPVGRLKARLTWPTQLIIGIIAFSTVLCLEFNGALINACQAIAANQCEILRFHDEQTFGPKDLAFFVMMAWALSAVLVHTKAQHWAVVVGALRKLTDELLVERSHAALMRLLEPHLSKITRAASRQLFWQKLHDRVAAYGAKKSEPRKLSSRSFAHRAGDFVFARVRLSAKHLARLIPAERKLEEEAQSLLRALLQSPEFRKSILATRPYFALSLLQGNLVHKFDFADALLRDLMSDPDSVLYAELRDELPTSRDHGYEIPDDRKLLRFLFGNVKVAQKLGIWSPIGDGALAKLGEDPKSTYISSLNRPPVDEHLRRRDPILCAIHFFDVMVVRTAYSKLADTMWLWYLNLMVSKIVAISDFGDAAVERESEHPTMGVYILRRSTDVMARWITMINDLPESSPHRTLHTVLAKRNSSIPYGAAVSLGRSLRAVIESRKVLAPARAYLFESIMRAIDDLKADDTPIKVLRALIIQAVIVGGDGTGDVAYSNDLCVLFAEIDPELRMRLPDFAKEVGYTLWTSDT